MGKESNQGFVKYRKSTCYCYLDKIKFMPHHYAKLSKSKTNEATWFAEALAGVNQAKGPNTPIQLQATQLRRSHRGSTNTLACQQQWQWHGQRATSLLCFSTTVISYFKVLKRVFKNGYCIMIIFRKYFKYLFVFLQTNKLTFHCQWMCYNKAQPCKEEHCCTLQYDPTFWQSLNFRFQHHLQKILSSFLE